MERTQIYVTENQKKMLASLAEKRGEPQSVLIREALDEYIIRETKEKIDKQKTFMSQYANIWADRDDMDGFIDQLRAGADSRLAHIHGGVSDQNQNTFDDGKKS